MPRRGDVRPIQRHSATARLVAAARLVEVSLQRVRQAAFGAEYQADIEPLLPATAGGLYSHYAAATTSVTSTLQRTLSAKANSHNMKAAVECMQQRARQGDKWELAHHEAVTAKGALSWKVVRPDHPHLRLSN